MNEQTTQLIRELAYKLGTTTEHLWGVLVAQARWEFISSTIQYGVILAFLLGFAKLARILWLNLNDEDWTGQHVAFAVTTVIVGLAAIGLIVAGFDYLPMYVASIANPEYWALKQILK